MKVNHRITSAARRKYRIRKKVQGTAERPRLNVFRSNIAIYLQVIDDVAGKTLLAARTGEVKKTKEMTKLAQAQAAAVVLAEKLKKAKVTKLVFDRGSYKYHGRVRAVAETLREQGIQV